MTHIESITIIVLHIQILKPSRSRDRIMGPPFLFVVLLEERLVRLSPDLMFSHSDHVVTYLFNRARNLCQVWDPLMVTVISLAGRWGDCLSPGSPSASSHTQLASFV